MRHRGPERLQLIESVGDVALLIANLLDLEKLIELTQLVGIELCLTLIAHLLEVIQELDLDLEVVLLQFML